VFGSKRLTPNDRAQSDEALTISVLCQTEIVIGCRHLLNRAVGQGRRHHRLDAKKTDCSPFFFFLLLVSFVSSRNREIVNGIAKNNVENETCANCCTLACSLAGDCFISSASLSLNFLNILLRAEPTETEPQVDKRDKRDNRRA